MMEFEPQTRIRLGGLVTAKSVKYLGKLASKLAGQVRERIHSNT
jgi:cytochrome c-type biogenesis protein CcmE